MPTVRSAAGLPFVYQTLSPVNAAYTYAPLTDNSTWRRKRPREIFQQPYPYFDLYTYHDVVDMEGNAATDGQVAFRFWGYTDPVWYTQTGITGLFTRQSGQWVLTPTQASGSTGAPICDINDNTLPGPNTVAVGISGDVATYLGAYPTTTYPDGYSNMATQGDYRGAWLFQEVRAIANQLNEVPVGAVAVPSYFWGSASSTVSYADAMSQLAASWQPGTQLIYEGMPSGTWYEAIYDSGTWYVNAQRMQFYLSVGSGTNIATMNKEIDTYVQAVPVSGGTFDAQGDNVTNGTYHQIDTTTTNATTYTTANINGDTVPPDAPPDPATTGGGSSYSAIIGYEIATGLAICKYNVTGGYTYTF